MLRAGIIWKGVITLCLLWLIIGRGEAQPFPVSGNVQLSSTHLPYLEDYLQQQPARLTYSIILNDFNRPGFDVILRISISGEGINIRTRPDFLGDVVTIESGILQLYTGYDLAPYFNPDNLVFSGITKEEFISQGRLPEGFYTFCIEAYDINRLDALPVSNTACAMGVIESFDPPVIIQPVGDQPSGIVQNLLMQWQPMHVGMFPVEYNLYIYETVPGLTDDQVITLTAPYSVASSMSTTFLYGPAEPLLYVDQDYILVVEVNDLTGEHTFKNQGRSQPQHFRIIGDCLVGSPCDDDNDLTLDDVYLDDCICRGTPMDDMLPGIPIATAAADLDSFGFLATWKDADRAAYYLLDVAFDTSFLEMVDGLSAKVVENIQYRVEDISRGQEYYYRLRAANAQGMSALSNVIAVPSSSGCGGGEILPYECGAEVDIAAPASHELMSGLQPGDEIYASDFKVVIDDLIGNNPYTGRGHISLPFSDKRGRVNVRFRNILINDECRMIGDGYMEVTGVAAKILSEEVAETIGDIVAGLEITDLFIMEIDGVLMDFNDLLNTQEGVSDYFSEGWDILDGAGDILEEYPYLDPDLIEPIDEAIACYEVIALTGGDASICQELLASALDSLTRALDSLFNGDFQVHFNESVNQYYGYDRYPGIDPLKGEYDQLVISGRPYDVPWKSVKTGTQDEIIPDASEGQSYNLRYEYNNQETIIPEINDQGKEVLSLTAGDHSSHRQVYAVQEKDDGSINLVGKLNLVSYDEKAVDVVIVPVNGVNYPFDRNELQARLDEIYAPAIARVNLSFHPGIEVPAFDNEMDEAETGFLSNYTDEMDDIINTLEVDDGAYVLFIVGSHEDPVKYGYMPRGRPYGFIYHEAVAALGQSHYEVTIAHEVAHGAFKLGHIYDDFPELGPGETDNLMDYGGGDRLYTYQWEFIHHPERNWSYNDSDEEGESINETVDHDGNEKEKDDRFLAEGPDSLRAFYTISGQVILLPKRARQLRFIYKENTSFRYKPQGALIGFVLDGERYYSWYTGYVSPTLEEYTHLGFYTKNSQGVRGLVYDNPTSAYVGRSVDVNVVYLASACEKIYGVFPNQVIEELDVREDPKRISSLELRDCIKTSVIDCEGGIISDEICWSDESTSVDAADVAACVDVLLEKVAIRTWETDSIRSKGIYHHIFHTEGSSVTMPESKAILLDEKLYLLQHHTGIRFNVVYHRTENRLSKEDAKNLAQQVSDGAGLSNGSSVLVVVPYQSNVSGTSILSCGNPGLYDHNASIEFPAYDDISHSVYAYCMAAFQWISKPLRNGFLVYLSDESVMTLQRNSVSHTTGYEAINNYKLYRSRHWDIVEEFKGQMPVLPKSDYAGSIVAYLEAYRAWEAEMLELQESATIEEVLALSGVNTANTFIEEKGALRLRESYMADTVLQRGYALFHYEENDSPFAELKESWGAYDFVDSEHLHEDISATELLFTGVDVLSIVLAPFGLDFVGDLLGMTFAIFSDSGPGRYIEYGSGIFIPLVIEGIGEASFKAYKVVRRIDDEGNTIYKALDPDDALEATDVFLTTIRAGNLAQAESIATRSFNSINGKIKPYYEAVVPTLARHTGIDKPLLKQISDEIILSHSRFMDNPAFLTDELAELLVRAGEGRTQVLGRISGWGDEVFNAFIADLGKNPALVERMAEEVGIVEAWEVLQRNSRTILKTDINALKTLATIRSNAKLSQVFPVNTLKEIDDILGKIEGIPNVSYSQMLVELEIAIEALPLEKSIDFWKVISFGKRGLINKNNVWDRRHSWLTLKKIKDNESFFQNADEIRFEVELEIIDGVNHAVPDIVVSIAEGQRIKVLIGEVKAGDNVITSNFNNQTIRYFYEIEDIRDLRFFSRDDVFVLKQDVIDSWKNGGVLDDDQVFNLFKNYDLEVSQTFSLNTKSQLESYLIVNSGWFNEIFKTDF